MESERNEPVSTTHLNMYSDDGSTSNSEDDNKNRSVNIMKTSVRKKLFSTATDNSDVRRPFCCFYFLNTLMLCMFLIV